MRRKIVLICIMFIWALVQAVLLTARGVQVWKAENDSTLFFCAVVTLICLAWVMYSCLKFYAELKRINSKEK